MGVCGVGKATVNRWELSDVVVGLNRRPDLVSVCNRRTEVNELMSTEGVGRAEVCITFHAGWRTRALFARLNDSILGGVAIVAWPSS